MAIMLNTKKKVLLLLAIGCLSLLAIGGVWYVDKKKKESINADITKLTCSYAFVVGVAYEELGKCISEAEKQAEVYARIKDEKQRLDFLINLCRIGSKSVLTEEKCKNIVWPILYPK